MVLRRVLVALGTGALLTAGLAGLAPSAAAATISVDFGQYANGTTIDQVSVPGLTFIAADPSTVVVNNGRLFVIGVSGVDLTVRVTDGTSISVDYQGTGNCQTSGYDLIGLSLDGTPVDSYTTNTGPLEGRCVTGTYAHAMDFDEFTVDVAPNQQMLLSSITADGYVPPVPDSPAPAPAPTPIIQGVPLPASGSCDSIADAAYSYGVAGLTGGWTPSWGEWADHGAGAAICTRTLDYSNALGRWVVAG